MRNASAIAVALTAVLSVATAVVAQDVAFTWNIPSPFPRPAVPVDNPMSRAKVEVGRRLFYDTRLSANGQQSCATCHRQELAFTDGKPRSVGSTGLAHPRGSMSLANVAYNSSLTWANPLMQSLEDQALVPMLGRDPIEMGLGGGEAQFIQSIEGDTSYQRLFARAFQPGSDNNGSAITMPNVVRALASFERTMISVQSPYDRYRYGGNRNAISESAKRGETFFYSGQRGSCFQCHGGWNFDGDVRYEARPAVTPAFFNTGLYNIAGETSYPATNTGLHQITHRSEDVGKFRVPTLRNIAVTAPYMHDGSIATLGEVLDHYAVGGRTIVAGPNAGNGHDNPNKSSSVHGFAMSLGDRADLLNFLESLTDSAFLSNPALSNPWPTRH